MSVVTLWNRPDIRQIFIGLIRRDLAVHPVARLEASFLDIHGFGEVEMQAVADEQGWDFAAEDGKPTFRLKEGA